MGTFFYIKVLTDCQNDKLEQLGPIIKSRLDVLEAEMSLYQPRSKISQLNKFGQVGGVSSDFIQLLQLSRESHSKTQGYFNPTVLPIIEEIKKQNDEFSGFNEAQKSQLKFITQMKSLKFDLADSSVWFTQDKMKLTLDGIAKGYAVEEVAKKLKPIFANFFLNFSGNVFAMGHDLGGDGWSLLVDNFVSGDQKKITLYNSALATSSSQYNFFSVDKKWHHVIDPVNVISTQRPTLTVRGPNAAVCDMLSTALLAMPSELAQKVLVHHYEGYFIVDGV
ncbi:MAG: FAD:protein FMN transferase [Bdellovibrionales bacterium]